MSLLEYLRPFVSDHKWSLFEEIVAKRTRRVTVVLEDLYQSHNASAVLRTCDCFGIQDVHIIENRNAWTTHKDIERGSTKWLTLHRYNDGDQNTEACLDQLAARGYALVATTPKAKMTLEDLPVDRPLALIFGTEKEGISETAIQRSQYQCRIPMYGFTESFNISVAAAVCLHFLRHRLDSSDIDTSLTADETQELLTEWSKRVLRNPERYVEEYHRRKGGR